MISSQKVFPVTIAVFTIIPLATHDVRLGGEFVLSDGLWGNPSDRHGSGVCYFVVVVIVKVPSQAEVSNLNDIRSVNPEENVT